MTDRTTPTDTVNTTPKTPPDAHMDELLEQARRQAWTGPDHSPRVDAFLKGIAMQSRPKFTRNALVLLGVGLLAGGSLAAAVTHNILTRRATLITDDGTTYDVQLSETEDGAAGSFVAEDGTVFGIDVIEHAPGVEVVEFDVNSPTGGTSTVILGDTHATVKTNPGEEASIHIIDHADTPEDPGEN